MPSPAPTLAPRRGRSAGPLLLCTLLLLMPCTAFCARAPQPSVRIPLEPLGFQPLPQRYLLGGSSMVTVHYVDGGHLLVTYVARRLIPRTPGDPPSDQDRNVDAVLLELPSGRVLARAEWLLHDHGQYLWPLGHGQFLLRVRNTFTTLAPLSHLSAGESFLLRPFLFTDRRVVLASLTADAGLLTIETAEPLPDPEQQPAARPAFTAGPPLRLSAPRPPSLIQFNFYRLGPLAGSTDPEAPITPRNAGVGTSRHAAELPISSAGMLHPSDQGHQRWAFDFRAHDGKITPLALLDSTCQPNVKFISPSEFVALGCHGGDSRQLLAGFNLRGDAMWELALSGPYLAPSFAYAPIAGRFAFARLLTSLSVAADTFLDSALATAQGIDVIQNDSGKTLLHLDCTPIVRAGQNFALAPDGMSLAILHDTYLEVYPLPPLAKEDKTALQLAERSSPAAAIGNVNLAEFPSAGPAGSRPARSPSTAPETVGPQIPAQTPADGQANSPEAGPSFATAPPAPLPEADPAAPSPVPRKPPTLYNPDAPSPTAAPQSSAPNQP